MVCRSLIEASKAAVDVETVQDHCDGEGDALEAVAPAMVRDEATVKLSKRLADEAARPGADAFAVKGGGFEGGICALLADELTPVRIIEVDERVQERVNLACDDRVLVDLAGVVVVGEGGPDQAQLIVGPPSRMSHFVAEEEVASRHAPARAGPSPQDGGNLVTQGRGQALVSVDEEEPIGLGKAQRVVALTREVLERALNDGVSEGAG